MTASRKANGMRWYYGAALVLALFTGFGNMPLYRRYYIADIPGLAWSGDFFANLYVHYLAGAVLLALSVYLCMVFWKEKRRNYSLTGSGLARVVALCLVLVSGVIMALKNLPGAVIPFPLVAVLNLGHMGLAMVAAALFVLSSILRWPWATVRRRI
jgi:uncharacterized membrane protein